MQCLYIVTVVALLVSAVKSPHTTLRALKVAMRKFTVILPAFLLMLVSVSVVLYLVPDRMIVGYLGEENKLRAVVLASFFGSVTIMPGFIAFPLCGVLLRKGVPYMVLSAFATTLMKVGMLTYPIEKEYFGAKVTIVRNLISLLIALAVAFATGVVFGEIF